MRVLLIILLAWLARRLAKKVRARRAHRKLVRQLKDLGVYGGTMCVKNTEAPPAPSPALSAKPDGPVPFGYKTAWLAVRCQDPRQAAAALSRPHRKRASWEAGLSCSLEPGGAVFFSPVMDDFVLAIGYELFALTEQQDKLEALAALFPEVQYFSSHRVSSSYFWVRYQAGACVRAYCVQDGQVLRSTGALTPEEQALGFDAFPTTDGQDTDCWPDEEDVLDIAAAWGIDPRFETKSYPPSTGWVCD